MENQETNQEIQAKIELESDSVEAPKPKKRGHTPAQAEAFKRCRELRMASIKKIRETKKDLAMEKLESKLDTIKEAPIDDAQFLDPRSRPNYNKTGVRGRPKKQKVIIEEIDTEDDQSTDSEDSVEFIIRKKAPQVKQRIKEANIEAQPKKQVVQQKVATQQPTRFFQFI
jgi:hypothetical protein